MSDLKIWITFLPWMNICTNLATITVHLLNHFEVEMTALECIFKELFHRFLAKIQFISIFYVVRTGFFIARGHKSSSNRFQIGLELTMIFVILIFVLSFLPLFFDAYESFCFLKQLPRFIETVTWLFLLLFIFIMSLSVICSKRFTTDANTKLIQLSCSIGILYFCFWCPASLLFCIAEIVGATAHVSVPIPVYYIFIALSNAVVIGYPFLCLRQKSTLFSSNLSNDEWNSVDMTPYEVFTTTS